MLLSKKALILVVFLVLLAGGTFVLLQKGAPKNDVADSTVSTSEVKKFWRDGRFVENYGEYELIRESIATDTPTVYHNKKYGFSITAPCYEWCFANYQDPSKQISMNIDRDGLNVGDITFKIDDIKQLQKINSEVATAYANFLIRVRNGEFNKVNLGNTSAFEISGNGIETEYNGRMHHTTLKQYVLNINGSQNLFMVVSVYDILGYEDRPEKIREELEKQRQVLLSITFDR